ncbi:SCO2525 family SAM-dependent methyltransferase [Actinoplanes sp. CA-030573]|uniref:SCO2525 family SAM-dependent methyltransferase n=1 Tax=Actinoplanes sp. CA-030573 TaxID=3239898 RepID=UPI003D8B9D34
MTRSVTLPVVVKHAVTNEDAPWDRFDSADYYLHNYARLRDDDRDIIDRVATFFAAHGPRKRLGRAIDVGSGTNLYPALTMLPFSAHVTLFERAFTNRSWLTTSLEKPQDSWRDFWARIATGREAYAGMREPLDVLAGRAEVTAGNVFKLTPGQYDLGTMFFVAESITTRKDEFERATQQFVGSLRPWGPFAAAFMCESKGYWVGDDFFPACSITEKDIRECLAPVARIHEIEEVESHGLREGYSGMIVATGWKR